MVATEETAVTVVMAITLERNVLRFMSVCTFVVQRLV